MDWRDIPLREIDWGILPETTRTSLIIARQCQEPTEWMKDHRPEEAAARWHTMTLGELADRGERWWRRQGRGFGKRCVEAIKTMIDHAAAGYEVRIAKRVAEAYVPRELPPPPPEKARRDPPVAPRL